MPGHTYFANNLPKKEHWRAYKEFRKNTIFLDIETTGLSPYYNEITIIGVHSSDGTKVFINGIDLEYFPQALKGARSFTPSTGHGSTFLLLSNICLVSISTRFTLTCYTPLRRLGLTRGQKRIETELGLSRYGETTGLSGFDAVRL